MRSTIILINSPHLKPHIGRGTLMSEDGIEYDYICNERCVIVDSYGEEIDPMRLLGQERYLESRYHNKRYRLISDLRPNIGRGTLMSYNGKFYSYHYACAKKCMIVDSQGVRINPLLILEYEILEGIKGYLHNVLAELPHTYPFHKNHPSHKGPDQYYSKNNHKSGKFHFDWMHDGPVFGYKCDGENCIIVDSEGTKINLMQLSEQTNIKEFIWQRIDIRRNLLGLSSMVMNNQRRLLGGTRKVAKYGICAFGMYLGKQTLDEEIRANKNSEQMRLEQFRSSEQMRREQFRSSEQMRREQFRLSLNEQMRANDINQRRLEHQISQDAEECHLLD